MPNRPHRIYEIDILRFIAAITVFFFHTTFRGKYYELYSFEFQELSLFSKYGFFGVDLFFIISGFVILMSIQNKTPTTFFQSRCVRLYPCFWFGVSFTALICYFLGSEIFHFNFWQYILNLTMLAGFLGVPDIDGVYWTLYVEIKFYIFIYLIMLIKKEKYLIYFLYIWAILSASNLVINIPWTIENWFILDWSHYFIAGAIFYKIREDGVRKEFITLLLTTYLISIIKLSNRIGIIADTYSTLLSLNVSILIVTVIFAVMTLISLKKVHMHKYGKLYIILGALSYPMYLLHHNIGFIYMDIMEKYMNKYCIIFTLLAIVILLSYVCTLYEKWMSKKLKYIIIYISNYKRA